MVKIDIKDNGIGIPAEEIPKVYERFYRADNTIGIGGFGLGLSISKDIVEFLNGTININSSLNY